MAFRKTFSARYSERGGWRTLSETVMAAVKAVPLSVAVAICAASFLAFFIEEAGSRPLGTHVSERNHRHKRQLGGIFNTVLDGVKSIVNTGTSVAGLGTGLLNIGGDEGIGGVVSGLLNLLSIGSEIFTGILGTVLNGDLLGGLLPFIGGRR